MRSARHATSGRPRLLKRPPSGGRRKTTSRPSAARRPTICWGIFRSGWLPRNIDFGLTQVQKQALQLQALGAGAESPEEKTAKELASLKAQQKQQADAALAVAREQLAGPALHNPNPPPSCEDRSDGTGHNRPDVRRLGGVRAPDQSRVLPPLHRPLEQPVRQSRSRSPATGSVPSPASAIRSIHARGSRVSRPNGRDATDLVWDITANSTTEFDPDDEEHPLEAARRRSRSRLTNTPARRPAMRRVAVSRRPPAA